VQAGLVTELVRVESLSHRFRDGVWGLEDVSLSVHEGDFLLLAGRNGSGKTLLMRHLVGLVEPSQGRVLYRGSDIRADLRRARAGVGLVFQDPDTQIVGQTVAEDVAFGPSNLRLAPEEIEKRTGRALGLVHLEEYADRRPDSLSGGERRRLTIAGVLAMHSECLVFDEPFANLDAPSIKSVISTAVELNQRGRTVVVLTHEIEKILAHATRFVVMNEGAIAYDGDPDQFPREAFDLHGLMDPYRGGLERKDLTWLR
jgi:biotin transport system ATP-binding protein